MAESIVETKKLAGLISTLRNAADSLRTPTQPNVYPPHQPVVQQWEAVKLVIKEALLPSYAASSRSSLEMLFDQIDLYIPHVTDPTPQRQSTVPMLVTLLSVLERQVTRGPADAAPPKSSPTPVPPPKAPREPDMERITTLLEKALQEKLVAEEAAQRSMRWTLGAGLGAIVGASLVALLWRVDHPLGGSAWAVALSMLARVLCVSALVYAGVRALRLYRELVSDLCLARSERARIALLGACLYAGDERALADPILEHLKSLAKDPTTSTDSGGLFLPMEFLDTLAKRAPDLAKAFKGGS